MEEEPLVLAAHKEKGEVSYVQESGNDSASVEPTEQCCVLPAKYSTPAKPVPKPRPRRNLKTPKEEEGDNSDSSTGPPLPPRPTRPPNDRGPMAPPDSAFDHYVGAAAFRPPTPPGEDYSLRMSYCDEDFYEEPCKYYDGQHEDTAVPVTDMGEGIYDDLPDTQPDTQSNKEGQTQEAIPVATPQQPVALPPSKGILKLPELPVTVSRSKTPPPPERPSPDGIVKKYRPPSPDMKDQKPVFLNLNTEKEEEVYEWGSKGDDDNVNYMGLYEGPPGEPMKDRALASMVDEHSPITENKKSIFYVLKKVTDHPGSSHWKNLTQALDKARDPFLENNENNESLLTVTARVGSLEVLKFLLKNGGNLNLHDNRSMYPIHTAAFYGHNNLIEYMINNHVNINMSGNKGNTPLHYATLKSKIATIDYLLRMGASVNARNHSGKKAYDFAKEIKNKHSLRLLEDAMTRTVGKSFDKVREEADNKPVSKKVQEELHRVRQDMQHQARKIEDIQEDSKKESQYIKKEIETIKEKAEEQDQKITAIETEYMEVQKTYHSQIMEQFQQLRVQQENMYEYSYTQGQYAPGPPMGPPQRGMSRPELHRVGGSNNLPMPHSVTCPVLTKETSDPDDGDGYDSPGDPSWVSFDVPDRGKLSKEAKLKIQKNYAKITRHAKVKRIDAELLSEFVIDFETKSHWKNCSEREVAEQFVQVLVEGTMEQLTKAKEVLRASNQEDIADLLP